MFAADAAGRIAHVHVKDVRLDLADRARRGELSLIGGGARRAVLPARSRRRADRGDRSTVSSATATQGWYVLEQDTDLGAIEPPPGEGPIDDVRASVEYLRGVLAGQRAG